MKAFLCAIGLGLISLHALAELVPYHLRCEYLVNPNGIDTPTPRLSWQLQADARGAKQAAYRIRVASTAAKLVAGQGDLWDSGKIAKDETVNVPYAGKALTSGQQAFGSMQVWSADTNSPATTSESAQ